MEKPRTISFSRRRLPHWKVVERSYFVTFRLRNTLPARLIRELELEKANLLSLNAGEDEMLNHQRRAFKKIEAILDYASDDGCHLAIPAIADEVLRSFTYLEEHFHWKIPCAVVMPNHVHCLMSSQLMANRSLEKSLGALKRHTAIVANQILDRKGRFWVDENFDHWCRTPDKERAIINYIRTNPVKAGLVRDWRDWKWLRDKA